MSSWRGRRFAVWGWHAYLGLREAPNRGCPSRREPVPRAELACRARPRGQPRHSADCRCVASSPRVDTHAPVVVDTPRGTSVAAAHHRLHGSDRPAPPRPAGSGGPQSAACVRPQVLCRTTPFVRWLARVAVLLWRRSGTPRAPVPAATCPLPRFRSSGRSRRHGRIRVSRPQCAGCRFGDVRWRGLG
jgi:hypothetical protein